MKCLFCGKEMVHKESTDLFVCETCDTHVYPRSKALLPGQKSPKWLKDSFACVQAISKSCPDCVIGDNQLFDPSFDSSKVVMLYQTRSDLAKVPVGFTRKVYANVAEDTKFEHLIAFQGVLVYGFDMLLNSTLDAIKSNKGIPVAKVFNVKAENYMHSMWLAYNLFHRGGVDELSEAICVRNVGTSTWMSVELQAAMAGWYYATRMKRISVTDGRWRDAVRNYMAPCIDRLNNPPADYIKWKDEVLTPALESPMRKELLEKYLKSIPTQYPYVGFDPEEEDGIDKMADKMASTSLSWFEADTVFYRYRFYRAIWKKLIPSYENA